VKPKFAWKLWYYTQANENLFLLDKDELLTFKLLVNEAFK